MKFSKKIFGILNQNYPNLLNPQSEDITRYYDSIKEERNKNAKLEIEEFINKGDSLPQISETHPFDVTPKFKIDYLFQELNNIRIYIAVSISACEYYLPRTSNLRVTSENTYDDFMYWFFVDYGIRLISSAWDRLAHYLYLAFEIDSPKLDINSVLIEIPKKEPDIVNSELFKNLKKIKDERLKEVEDKYSRGLRNEIDHILSSFTRFFC